MVRVKLFANFREVVGKKEIEVEAKNLNGLLEKLSQDYPEIKKLYDYMIVVVNGKIVKENVELRDDDVVALMPPVSGGELFSELTPVKEAQKIFLNNIEEISSEKVPLEEAFMRVAAEDIKAEIDIPHYNRAAMDGFAVVSEAVRKASRSSPVILKKADFVDLEHAKWVHTGDALPENADAVVKAEDAEELGEFVAIYKAVRRFENVGLRGEDVRKGEVIVEKGEVLKPQHLSLLRSAGVEEIKVFRKPKILVVPTGDELLPPKSQLVEGKVYESNSILVGGLARLWGCDVDTRGIVRDSEEDLRRIFENIDNYNILITLGGTSVGKRDYMYKVLDEIGEVLFRGVALRPGKPTIAALVNEKPVLALPGFPAACFASAYLFLKPAVEKMLGMKGEEGFKVVLEDKIYSKVGFTSFVRLKVSFPEMKAKVISSYGSGILSSITKANAYTLVEENVEVVEKGEAVVAYRI